MSTTYDRIVPVLEDSLGCEPGSVSRESHLLDDLGADSLDMLELTFQLEKEFRVKFERDRLFPDWLFYNNSEFVSDGRLTDAGAARLKTELPFLVDVPAGTQARSLLTVGMLAGGIDRARCEHLSGARAA